MRVMVIVKATEDSEKGVMPAPELLEAMGKFNQELQEAGILMDGAGLRPSREGKRVRFGGRTTTVMDGPFAETKELVAGYWVWQVASMEDAVGWAERCPNPMPGTEGVLEIRPLYEAEDFVVS